MNPNDPTAIGHDPSCADTPADAAGGQLGMLAQLLRRLFNKIVPPWYVPPNGFQPFDIQGLIALPAVGAGATVILELPVPQGMDCVVRRLSHNALVAGFIEGSGDLVWSITVDNSPVKNYGVMLTEFGSIGVQGAGPRPTDGILAKSGQVIRYNITNVALMVGGGQALSTLGGWFYPRVRKSGQGYTAG